MRSKFSHIRASSLSSYTNSIRRNSYFLPYNAISVCIFLRLYNRVKALHMHNNSSETIAFACLDILDRRTPCLPFTQTPLTVLHRHTFVLDATDVTAQFILPIRILHQFRLHAEAPHLFQGVSGQLHLIQYLGAHLNHFVRMQLDKKGKRTDE